MPERRSHTRWPRLAGLLGRAAREVHFLHIGKNAGTQIKAVIAQINAAQTAVRLVPHDHHTFLRHLPSDAEFFFSVRDPIARFRSGFYSRKRKGQPRIYSEWTAHEAQAFATFEHANDLAEALFTDGPRGAAALRAITSISHTAMQQIDWFYGCGHILDLRPPVAVLRQEALEADIAAMKRALSLDVPTALARDDAQAHRNDYAAVPPLSERARANLARWYARDIAFVEDCRAWAAAHQG